MGVAFFRQRAAAHVVESKPEPKAPEAPAAEVSDDELERLTAPERPAAARQKAARR